MHHFHLTMDGCKACTILWLEMPDRTYLIIGIISWCSHDQFFHLYQDPTAHQKLFQKGCIIIYCRWWGFATESKEPICHSSTSAGHILQFYLFPPLTPPYVCQVVRPKWQGSLHHDLDLMQQTLSGQSWWLSMPVNKGAGAIFLCGMGCLLNPKWPEPKMWCASFFRSMGCNWPLLLFLLTDVNKTRFVTTSSAILPSQLGEDSYHWTS